jgi:Arc/MetJ-type ribon-helix-helix transcriptional regulator
MPAGEHSGPRDYEVVSFALPRPILEKVDSLVRGGTYVSRSEVFRAALLAFLKEAEAPLARGERDG